MSTTKTRALDLSKSTDRAFVHLLVNTLLVSVINFTVWFAVTFWVFLETKSVLATGMVAGIFLVATALSGIWFGSLVDHHRKKTVMQASAVVSLAFYAVAFTLYQLTPGTDIHQPGQRDVVGVHRAGDARSDRRKYPVDRPHDIGHPLDSRGSQRQGQWPCRNNPGSVVPRHLGHQRTSRGRGRHVLRLAAGHGSCWDSALCIWHSFGSKTGPKVLATPDAESADLQPKQNKVDLRGTLRVVRGVPGLLALIGFACFNNFLGGAFMALMDAYGLYLVSVQTWGLLWGALSAFFIIGGLAVAKTGLSKNPVRLLLLVNVAFWTRDLPVPAAVLGDLAGGGYGHLHAVGAVRRSVRADHPSEGRALRAAGPGLWVRPEC